MVVWVFETQSLFGAVLLQVRQLLAVDGAPALPVRKKQQQISISYINVFLIIIIIISIIIIIIIISHHSKSLKVQ